MSTTKKPTGIIYRAFNKISGKSYVGQSRYSLEKRKKRHYETAKKGDYKFPRALRKYSEESWTWEVLIEVEIEKLDEYERFFIKNLDTYHNGYNSCRGGGWKGEGSPSYNDTVYEVYHRDYGFVSGVKYVLVKIDPALDQISELVSGVRTHSCGWILAKNIESYDQIREMSKEYEFYHFSEGIVKCSCKELATRYLEGECTSDTVYRLAKGRIKCTNNWILASNKDKYNNLVNLYTSTISLYHKDYGEHTLSRKEFEEKFGLNKYRLSKVEKGTLKNHKGWVLAENKDNYEVFLSNKKSKGKLLTLTHLDLGTYSLFQKEWVSKFGLRYSSLAGLIKGEQKSHKGWTLVEDKKDEELS